MGVALYFVDKLALRAGHEKDEDEADTVGCCTLKVCYNLPFRTLDVDDALSAHRMVVDLNEGTHQNTGNFMDVLFLELQVATIEILR